MSVATKNPFALLDAEDTSRPATPAAPAATEAAGQPSAAAPNRGSQKPRGGPASRGGKYYQRGGAKTAVPRENDGEEFTLAGGDKPKRTFDGEGRGDGRGRGRGGRGRGGDRGGNRGGDRGGDRPPREGGGERNYRNREPRPDRHSATGKTDSDKKVHQSWGGDDGNTEFKVEEAATVDAAAEATANDWGADAAATPADDPWATPAPTGDEPVTSATDGWGDAPAPAAGGAGGEKTDGRRGGRDREPEEEDNTLTLEQYLAQKAEKEASLLPKLEVRRANEGADESLWKDAIKVTKGEEEEAYFAGKAKAAPKARTQKAEKVYIPIEPTFQRPDRPGRGGRGGRGDRGGDRGDRGPRPGRGRGGRDRPPNGNYGGYANSPSNISVDDESAFPSLS